MTAADVDDYLTTVPAPHREALTGLRAMLEAVLPDADQLISYGVPTFRVNGKGVAGFGFAKGHCSYYPMSGTVTATLADQLGGHVTSKGSIQFSAEEPLSRELVERLVGARLAELHGGALP